MPINNIKENGRKKLIVKYFHAQNGYKFFTSDKFIPEDDAVIANFEEEQPATESEE